MNLRSLPVRNAMSRLPEELAEHESIARARECMESARVRHLPILRGPSLIGVISSRDIDRLYAELGEEAGDLIVSDVCSHDIVTVAPVQTVSEVAAAMLHDGVGSAIVTDGDVIVGIFTTADALRVLAGS